jgi:hypothetical protein
VSFAPRSFHVVPGPLGHQEVAVATVLSAADARALGEAVAWQRTQDFLAPSIEDAGGVQALRAIVRLVDVLDELPEGGPVTLSQGQVALLAEAASRYVAERDVEGHQPAPERERLGKLRELQGPLFDTVADFAGAEAELRAAQRDG